MLLLPTLQPVEIPLFVLGLLSVLLVPLLARALHLHSQQQSRALLLEALSQQCLWLLLVHPLAVPTRVDGTNLFVLQLPMIVAFVL